jgi:transforming growth factor-beta-induced protein
MRTFISFSTIALTFALAGCSSDGSSAGTGNMNADGGAQATGGAPGTMAGDIVAVASGAGSFKTLVAAVQAADLVTTLQGAGPFTVFAPTDSAFAALPAGTVDTLLKPENKAKLVDILTYHVVPGKVTAADVVKLTDATTVEGKKVTIKVVDGKVVINDATVTTADVAASNGVIHVIDKVLLPPM